jgi:hypothetical protein
MLKTSRFIGAESNVINLLRNFMFLPLFPNILDVGNALNIEEERKKIYLNS